MKESLELMVKQRPEDNREASNIARTEVFLAERFNSKFKMKEILNFDENRVKLFATYFARYSILKRNYRRNRLHPLNAELRTLDEYSFVSLKAVEILENEAKTQKLPLAEERELFASKNPLMDSWKIDKRAFSAEQIESIANCMSTLVVNKPKNWKIAVGNIRRRYLAV